MTTMTLRDNARKPARRTLLWMCLVCVAPIIASYAAFYGWRPAATANRGALVSPPVPVAWPTGVGDTLRGKWVLAVSAGATCDDDCAQALYMTRQVRTAQGKDMHRVVRAVVMADGNLSPAQDDDTLVHVQSSALVTQLNAEHAALVDPMGNLVLRYSLPLDGPALNKDLGRLLKYSSLGR